MLGALAAGCTKQVLQAKVKPRTEGNAQACAPLVKEVWGHLPAGAVGVQKDGSITEANGVTIAALTVGAAPAPAKLSHRRLAPDKPRGLPIKPNFGPDPARPPSPSPAAPGAGAVSTPAQAPTAAHQLALCYDRARRFTALGALSFTATFAKGGKLKAFASEPKLTAAADNFAQCVGVLADGALKTALKDGAVLAAKLAPPDPALLLAPTILPDDAAPLLLTIAPSGPRQVRVTIKNRTQAPYKYARRNCGLTTLRVLGVGLRPLATDEPPCAGGKTMDVVINPGDAVAEFVDVRAREGFKHMPYAARIAVPAATPGAKGLICSNQVIVETEP